MAKQVEPIDGTDLVSIVLYGAFQQKRESREEGWAVLFKPEVDMELMSTLYRERDKIPLIKEHYHFDAQGAFPYSREVNEALNQLAEVTVLKRLMGEGRIGTTMLREFAERPLQEGRISQEDYKKLFDLGRELPVNRAVFI